LVEKRYADHERPARREHVREVSGKNDVGTHDSIESNCCREANDEQPKRTDQ